MFVYRYTLYNRPSQACGLYQFLAFFDFFYCPYFTIRNVMERSYYTGCSSLTYVL